MTVCAHGPDCELHACFEQRHRAEHPVVVDGCLACKLDTLIVSQKVKGQRPGCAPPAASLNSWERGIAKDHRGVPLLGAGDEPIGVKQAAQHRHQIETVLRDRHNNPNPLPV